MKQVAPDLLFFSVRLAVLLVESSNIKIGTFYADNQGFILAIYFFSVLLVKLKV